MRKSKPNENDIFSLSAHPSMSADKVLAGFVSPLLAKEKIAQCWSEKRRPTGCWKTNSSSKVFRFTHRAYLSVKMKSSIFVLITSNEIGFTK